MEAAGAGVLGAGVEAAGLGSGFGVSFFDSALWGAGDDGVEVETVVDGVDETVELDRGSFAGVGIVKGAGGFLIEARKLTSLSSSSLRPWRET